MADDDRRDGLVRRGKLEHGLPLQGPKPGLSKSDPACPEPRGAGREHQVLRSEGTVFDGPWDIRHGGNHNENRGMIEDVKIRIVQYLVEMM